jgi:hypothetical protein
MGVTPIVLATLAAAAIVSQVNGSGPDRSETRAVEAIETRTLAPPVSCVAMGSYTVFEVGTYPNTERKKVTNNCWWQYPVPFLHGYVQEPMGWQFCNFCTVGITFRLRDLPGDALLGCPEIDPVTREATITVASGDIGFIDCYGGRVVSPPDHYWAEASEVNQNKFIGDDPELEIENRGLAPEYELRLVDAKGLTQCIDTISTSQKRMTISGEFAPSKVGASVVLVPASRRYFGSTWGGDLVEMASQKAAVVTGAKLEKFSVRTELPPTVIDFVLRDKAGPKPKLIITKLGPCATQ